MSEQTKVTLENAVQERIDKDTEFQAKIKDLPDEDKTKAVDAKRGELREIVFNERSEEAAKQAQIASDQRKRAEKAEGKGNETKDLSSDEIFAISEAKISREDISVVKDYAALHKVSIEDSLKADVVKSIIADRVAKRTTAAATQTGGSNRQTTARDGATILADARKGGEEAIPEPGSKDAEALFLARRGRGNLPKRD